LFPALLKQVWVNLLSNAIKYSGSKDHARIEIGSLGDSAPERSGITYFVRDNGVGFDMRYYEKLFGVFQRLHSEGMGRGRRQRGRYVLFFASRERQR